MIRDLLLELLGVNVATGLERFDFGVVFAQAGIQEQGFLRDRFLIDRQNLQHGRILDIQGRQHSHQVLAFDVLDLLQLRGENRRLSFPLR